MLCFGYYSLVLLCLSIPKCFSHLSLELKNRLYAQERMLKFGLNVDPRCVLCNRGLQTLVHIFAKCTYSKFALQDDILCGNWIEYFRGYWSEYLRGEFFVMGNVSKAKKLFAYLIILVKNLTIWREHIDIIHKVGPLRSAQQI